MKKKKKLFRVLCSVFCVCAHAALAAAVWCELLFLYTFLMSEAQLQKYLLNFPKIVGKIFVCSVDDGHGHWTEGG